MKTIYLKYLYSMLMLLPLLCQACDDKESQPKEKPEEKPSITFPTSVTPSPELDAGSSTATVNFTATGPWKASVDINRSIDWLSVSPTSGDAGNITLSVKALENETYDDRNGAVTITCGSNSASFTVNQKKKDGLIIESSKQEIESEGGTLTFTALSNNQLSFEIADDAKEWISLLPGSRGLESVAFTVNVSPNNTPTPRQGAVRVTAGSAKETIYIYQRPFTPYIIVSEHEVVLPSQTSTFAIEVKSNTDFSFRIAPKCTWLKTDESGSRSSYTLRFTADENTTPESRETSITFISNDGQTSESVRIIQSAMSAIAVAKDYYEVPCTASELNFTVQSNTKFDVRTDCNWIRHAGQTRSRAFVDYQLCFDIDANNDPENTRTGKIILCSNDRTITQTITIVQNKYGKTIVSIEPRYYVFFESFPTAPTNYWNSSEIHLVQTTTYTDGSKEHQLINPDAPACNFMDDIPMLAIFNNYEGAFLRRPFSQTIPGDFGYDDKDFGVYQRGGNFDAEYLSPILRCVYYSKEKEKDLMSISNSFEFRGYVRVPRHEVRLSVPASSLQGEIVSPVYYYSTTCDESLRDRFNGYYEYHYPSPQPYLIRNIDNPKEKYEFYNAIRFFSLTDYEQDVLEKHFGKNLKDVPPRELRSLSVDKLFELFSCKELPNPLLGLPDGEYSLNALERGLRDHHMANIMHMPATEYCLIGNKNVKVRLDDSNGTYGSDLVENKWHELHYPLARYFISRFAVMTINGRKTITHTPDDTGEKSWSLSFETVEDTDEATVIVATIKTSSESRYSDIAPLPQFQRSNSYGTVFRNEGEITDTLVCFKERPGSPFTLGCHIQYEQQKFRPVEIIPSAFLTNPQPEDFIVTCEDISDLKVVRASEYPFSKYFFGKLAIDLNGIGPVKDGIHTSVVKVSHKDFPDYVEKVYLTGAKSD